MNIPRVFSSFRTASSTVVAGVGGFAHTKKRRARWCNCWPSSHSLVVWTGLLLAGMYILLGVKLEWIRGAVKNVKLRSSKGQNDHHHDTTFIGRLDLGGHTPPPVTIDKEWFEKEFRMAGLEEDDEKRRYTKLINGGIIKDFKVTGEGVGVGKVAKNVIFVDSLAEAKKLLKTPRPDVNAKLDIPYHKEKGNSEATINRGQRASNSVESIGIPDMVTPVEEEPPSPKTGDIEEDTTGSGSSESSIEKPVKVNFGYDVNVSEGISVDRQVPDGRHLTCRAKYYPDLKLQATVIISVYNEAWHVLRRTIHSVINRTPKHLLKAVIIIDDFSDKALLNSQGGETLEEYVKQWDNVHVQRNDRWEGLLWSRMAGVKLLNHSGEALVFLDSHVEVNVGWLEPLLQRVAKEWRFVAVPVVEEIDPHTWKYKQGSVVPKMVDGFRWSLQTIKVSPKEETQRKLVTSPVATPVMGHGMFAISRQFFTLLGGFDPGMELFGGENLEMSFKAWMCGGRVEIVPCSRIGHVARGRLPALVNSEIEDKINRNLLRVAKTWMDDHSILFVNSINTLKDVDFGDITGRLQLKKSLDCHSFTWYLQNIIPSLYDPMGKLIADTDISNVAQPDLCLDALSTGSSKVTLFSCHGHGGNQRWWYTTAGEFRRYDQCLDYWGTTIQFISCHGAQGNQLWIYMSDVRKIKHVRSGKCLTLHSVADNTTVQMKSCLDEDDSGNDKQQWTLNNFNETAYEESGFGN